MEFIKCDLRPMRVVRLFPIGDWHYGSAQCHEPFVKKIISIIADDPRARWVGMGDLMENAIIGTKSDVYMATKNPETQVKEIVAMLMPIKDKCLFMIPGNHEERTMRMVGLHPDAIIAAQLMVPFIGYSALASISLLYAPGSGQYKNVTCYFHHNTGGGYTPGGKVNAAAKLRQIVPTVDATFSGHSHTTSRQPVLWYEAAYNCLKRVVGYDYIIGSTLTYNGSYAEEKAKRPAAVEQIAITFSITHPRTKGGRGSLEVFQGYEVIQP